MGSMRASWPSVNAPSGKIGAPRLAPQVPEEHGDPETSVITFKTAGLRSALPGSSIRTDSLPSFRVARRRDNQPEMQRLLRPAFAFS